MMAMGQDDRVIILSSKWQVETLEWDSGAGRYRLYVVDEREGWQVVGLREMSRRKEEARWEEAR